jgi:hypothetical protein
VPKAQWCSILPSSNVELNNLCGFARHGRRNLPADDIGCTVHGVRPRPNGSSAPSWLVGNAARAERKQKLPLEWLDRQ